MEIQDLEVNKGSQLNNLLEKIDKLMKEKSCVVVGIDGSCTSGKSTLAGWLAKQYDCNVFHMDDFFLRPEQRTEERLMEPGGNVDRERFMEEVLLPIMKWKKFDIANEINSFTETAKLDDREVFGYRPYDCSIQKLGKIVEVEKKKLNIIEGSYSLHPELEYVYDLKVLLTIQPQLREQRIQKRAVHLHKRFFEEWIPMEQRYFNSSNITERCDIIMSMIDIPKEL